VYDDASVLDGVVGSGCENVSRELRERASHRVLRRSIRANNGLPVQNRPCRRVIAHASIIGPPLVMETRISNIEMFRDEDVIEEPRSLTANDVGCFKSTSVAVEPRMTEPPVGVEHGRDTPLPLASGTANAFTVDSIPRIRAVFVQPERDGHVVRVEPSRLVKVTRDDKSTSRRDILDERV
jgi:hypothetical protein